MTDEQNAVLELEKEERRKIARRKWWYAVQVEPGFEFDTVKQLLDSVYISDAYCPSYRMTKKASRHIKKKPAEADVPLFRKWLFVQFTNLMRPWEIVLNCNRHVEGFLSIGGSEPVPIRDYEIATLRRECVAGVFNEKGLAGLIQAGDKVLIKDPSERMKSVFEGFTGTYMKLNGSAKATIELSILGRETAVEIPVGMIERLF